jgi:hypothetical protein
MELEPHRVLDPIPERRVPQPGEGGEHPLAELAVAGQVVAGHDREGGEAALAPPP